MRREIDFFRSLNQRRHAPFRERSSFHAETDSSEGSQYTNEQITVTRGYFDENYVYNAEIV